MVNVYGECEYSVFHDKYVKIIMILYKQKCNIFIYLYNSKII